MLFYILYRDVTSNKILYLSIINHLINLTLELIETFVHEIKLFTSPTILINVKDIFVLLNRSKHPFVALIKKLQKNNL